MLQLTLFFVARFCNSTLSVGRWTLSVECQSGSDCRALTLTFFLALLLASCAGSPHPQLLHSPAAAPSPAFLELNSEMRVATLRFPPGVYSLYAVDRIGYYYHAPRGIVQRTGLSSAVRRGGIFVSKRNRAKLRGYVYLAGTVTHIGNLSRANYRFRD